MKIRLEAAAMSDGARVFRWACECGRHGVWLGDLNVADRNGSLHEKHEHPKAAVA